MLFVFLFCIGVYASPFAYDLHLHTVPGSSSRTLICMHGYGGNYRIADKIKIHKVTEATLVSFNFPDHDLETRPYEPEKASFGTLEELLPAFYVLKKCVIDEGLEAVDLYGYSAGGGVLVNLLAGLNSERYNVTLEEIGIAAQEKKKLLMAIQKGIILLDVPLKSVEEIIAGRGTSPELEILAQHYQTHQLRPIDALDALKGLSLDVILYIQEPDDIVLNRDDALYIQRLKSANARGRTTIVKGSRGDHFSFHPLLWQAYAQKLREI